MNTVEFASHYSSNDSMRESLYPLFEKVFDINTSILKDFYARGFWNPTYRPYTFFENGTAIANVSAFSMPLIVNQKLIKAAGIQSVMTEPNYRGKGLMKQLFEKMLLDIDKEFEVSLLMTDIPDLYTPFGFRKVQEYYFVAPIQHTPSGENKSLRNLDFFNDGDLEIVKEMFQNHMPISHHFAPVSHATSFYLNMYDPYYQKMLYYSEDLKVILVFEVEEETLKLYDCVGAKLPKLEDLCAQIPHSFSQIEFYFYPDRFLVTSFKPIEINNGSSLMIRGNFDIEPASFTLPITASF